MGIFGFRDIKDMFDGGGRNASRESSSSSRSSSSADRGSSSGDRPSSIEINGRTVTDPRQIDRIQRNREASARYAVEAYRQEGAPIPAHLRGTVDAQIARGDYGSPSSGPRRGNLLDLFLGPAPGSTASILGTPRPGPTPGPGYYAGLGAPGVARDDAAPMSLPAAVVSQPPVAPVVDTAVADPAATAASYVPPAFVPMAAPSIAVDPQSQFTFEQYLARLNDVPQNLMLPPVAPLQLPPLNQGIGSLARTGLV